MTTILSINLTASVLILGIVLFRALALCRFPRKLFLLLWGIVALRLLIPVSLPIYLPNNFGQTPAQVEVSNVPVYGEIITVPDTPPSTQAAPAPFEFPYEAIWLIGVCTVAIFFLISYVRFRKIFKASETCENEAVNHWLVTLPLKRGVQVRQSREIGSPLTYGIFRPVILLPNDMDLSDEKKMQFILTHEAVHIRRFDAAVKLLLTVVVCLHWFNPLVWALYVLANRDIELSCDEAVVKQSGYETRSEYAHILIGLVETRSRRAFPLVSYFGKHAEEERITSLMKVKRYSVPIIVAAVSVLLCGGVLAAFAVSSVEYVPLWENPSQEEIDALTTYFDAEGADDYRIEDGTIYVPEDRVEDYKWLTLLATFEPSAEIEYESVYLEDFPSGDRDLAYIHALQNRLGKVIEEYAGVKEATVIITDGKDDIPLASVMVTMEDESMGLSNEQATAIRRMVKNSVNGLTEENISISTMDGVIYNNVHVDTEVTVRQLTPLEMEVKTQLTTAVQAFDDVELIEVNVWTDKQGKINAEINLEEDNDLSAEQFQEVIDLHHSILPAEQVGFVSVRAMVATKGISYGESGEGTGDGSGPVYDRIYIHDTETGITYEMRNVTLDDIVKVFPGDRYMVQEEAPQRPLDGYTEVYVPGQQNFDSTTAPSWSEGEEKPVPIILISDFEHLYSNEYSLIDEMEFSLTADNPSAVYEGSSDTDVVISFVDNGPVTCIVTIEGTDSAGTYKCGFAGEGAVRIKLAAGASYKVEYQLGVKTNSSGTPGYLEETVDASSGIIKVYMEK